MQYSTDEKIHTDDFGSRFRDRSLPYSITHENEKNESGGYKSSFSGIISRMTAMTLDLSDLGIGTKGVLNTSSGNQ